MSSANAFNLVQSIMQSFVKDFNLASQPSIELSRLSDFLFIFSYPRFLRSAAYYFTVGLSVCTIGWLVLLRFNANLTRPQTTNLRLFKTKRVCRRQFQTLQKWQKAFKTGRKHCGKRRNCSLRAISPFPTVFSKDLYWRHVKNQGLFGKGLTAKVISWWSVTLVGRIGV